MMKKPMSLALRWSTMTARFVEQLKLQHRRRKRKKPSNCESSRNTKEKEKH